MLKRRRGATAPRPGLRRDSVTLLRIAPLIVAVAIFALSEIIGGIAGATLFLGGMVAVVVAVPFVLPAVIRSTGAALGRAASPLTAVAGRGMEWSPIRIVRPFTGGALLIIIALTGSGYLALLQNMEQSYAPPEGTNAVLVSWPDLQPNDTERFADSLGAGFAVPMREKAGSTTLGVRCRELATYFPDRVCDPESPFELPGEIERGLIATRAFDPGTSFRLAPRKDVAAGGSMVVLGEVPLENLEKRVRNAAMQTLPAPYVFSALVLQRQESPLVPWIGGGVAVAVIALTVGCLTSLVDRLLGTRSHRRHLLNLGLSARQLTALEAWLFAAPYALVVIVGFSLGLAMCTLVVGLFSDIPMPWDEIGLTLTIAAVGGILGTASLAFFGARSIFENSE